MKESGNEFGNRSAAILWLVSTRSGTAYAISSGKAALFSTAVLPHPILKGGGPRPATLLFFHEIIPNTRSMKRHLGPTRDKQQKVAARNEDLGCHSA
jgi:hypothetical protein